MVAALVLDIEADGFALNLNFSSYDGFDALFLCSYAKFNGAVEISLISQRNGWQFLCLSPFN